MPVPPGFTISTEACSLYYRNRGKLPQDLKAEIAANLAKLERTIGRKLGDPKNPLLVSVRSGAKFSMPGMMDTVLNLGLNDKTVEGLARKSRNPRFAYDSYCRFLMMFSDVVLDLPKSGFEQIIAEKKQERGVAADVDLAAEDLMSVCGAFKALVKESLKKEFPQDPRIQLELARDAVFRSWNNDRARYYRKANGIPDDIGTAVNVQAMVFGNMGDDCATGVGFTRNPATGAREYYGEYLVNAQGEDVVAGTRTPRPIRDMKKDFPKVFDQLMRITAKLEKHYRDVQDFEFTIENNTLYMLQTRNGKRTAAAAVKIAVDMVKEKLITKEEALLRLEPRQIDQLLHPVIDPKAKLDVIAKGLPASPGAATGAAVFHADKAVEWATEGKDVILVRKETSPDDIHGMDVARGILTATGGMTSHAAVVARQMGKTCVAGCDTIDVDETTNRFMAGGKVVREGDFISLNGTTGEVILGKAPLIAPAMTGAFAVFMSWADAVRRLKVRANADTQRDARVARNFGAEGIGLCRTEHMFFAEDRIPIMQEMILARTREDREAALSKLLPMQRDDFKALYREMKGYPVTIRLLDPPLHEFLPKREELMVEVTKLQLIHADRSIIEEKKRLLERVRGASRVQPDARSSRLPARDLLPGDHPDAGARDLRGGVRRHPGRDPGPPRGDDSSGQHGGGDEGAEGDRRRRGGRDDATPQEEVPLHRRDDDRVAARRDDGGRDRDRGRVLLLRHERPHPDDVRVLPGRLRKVHPALHEPFGALPGVRHEAREGPLLRRVQGDLDETGGEYPRSRRLRDLGPGRGRAARPDGRRERAFDTSNPQGRDLRGARRRPEVGRVLPRHRARLRLLFSLSGSHRAPRGGPGGSQGEEAGEGSEEVIVNRKDS